MESYQQNESYIWKQLEKIMEDSKEIKAPLSPELEKIFRMIKKEKQNPLPTGLHDYQGEPIYEGDTILKVYSNENLSIKANVFYDKHYDVFGVKYTHAEKEVTGTLHVFMFNITDGYIVKEKQLNESL